MRKNTPPIRNIFSSKATTGSGTVVSVSDWKHIVLQIGTASSANLTLKAVPICNTICFQSETLATVTVIYHVV